MSLWSLAEMHATFIVICMPSMAKFILSCRWHLSPARSCLPLRRPTRDGDPGAMVVVPPGGERDGPRCARRDPLSRIMDALGVMTSGFRPGLHSSQESLTETCGPRAWPGAVEERAHECRDHAGPYPGADRCLTKEEDLELRVMSLEETKG